MGVNISGGGTITGLVAGGIANNVISIFNEVDQWRIHTTYTGTTAFLTSNWERNDTTFEKIGTGLTESSGVFTFPSTGKYLIKAQANMRDADGERSAGLQIHVTTNNSSYTSYADANGSLSDIGGVENTMSHANCECIVDVTDVANVKFKLKAISGTSIQFDGNSTVQMTGVTVLRLGDT